MSNLLCVDPGFSRTGWAVFNGDALLCAGLIETEKDPAKMRKSDDVVDRCALIAQSLAGEIWDHEITRVAWEVPPGGAQSASALGALERIKGVMAAVLGILAVPDTRFTPQAVKLAACGTHKATKQEIETAVLKRWPGAAVYLPRAKARREHICDALAVHIAFLKKYPAGVLPEARGVECGETICQTLLPCGHKNADAV